MKDAKKEQIVNELVNKLTTQAEITDINNYNGYYLLLLGDNMDYATA